jgi:hypothetical protein
VGSNKEKLKSEGGGFKSELVRSGGKDTRDRKREIGTK